MFSGSAELLAQMPQSIELALVSMQGPLRALQFGDPSAAFCQFSQQLLSCLLSTIHVGIAVLLFALDGLTDQSTTGIEASRRD